MIIPHIIDQFVWNKITTKNLESKILELVNYSSYIKNAEQIASQMGKENFRDEIYKSIIEK